MTSGQHIIFQAYGHIGILTEAVVAVASIKAQASEADPITIHIWTDQPAFFKQYRCCNDVSLHTLDKPTIQDWAGERQFVHRVKIKLIEQATQLLAGKLIYLDTDVVLTTDIRQLFDQISPKHYLMHSAEGTLADSNLPLNRKIGRFLRNRPIAINGQKVIVPQTTMMHNAGVIGFETAEGPTLVAEVLATSDALYAAWNRHTMEQLAFSYVLGKGHVMDTTPQVTHYWRLKPLRPQLKMLIDAHAADQASDLYRAIMQRFDLNKLNTEMTEWELKPSLLRSWLKLIGRDYRLHQLPL